MSFVDSRTADADAPVHAIACESPVRRFVFDVDIGCCIEKNQHHDKPDAQTPKTYLASVLRSDVSESGSVVSPEGFLEHRFVQFRFRQQPFQTSIFSFEIFQPFGFLAFHAAILAAPPSQRCLTHFHHLQNLFKALPTVQHHIRVTQLLDDLFRGMSLRLFFI